MLTSLSVERFVAPDVHKHYVVVGAINAHQLGVEQVYQMGSGFPWRRIASAHDWRRLLTFHAIYQGGITCE